MSRWFLRIGAVVGAVIVAAAAAGAAYGYFSAHGSGAGSGSSSTGQQLTIGPGTPSADLYPGGAASVVLVIVNPTGSPARVSTLALDTTQGSSGFAVDLSHSSCSTSALDFITQSTGWDVAADSSLPVTLPGAVTMAASAGNACQGATFTVYLEAS